MCLQRHLPRALLSHALGSGVEGGELQLQRGQPRRHQLPAGVLETQLPRLGGAEQDRDVLRGRDVESPQFGAHSSGFRPVRVTNSVISAFTRSSIAIRPHIDYTPLSE